MKSINRKGAKAIRDCLMYLQEEAIDLDLEMTARLLGATIEELNDTLQVRGKVIPGPGDGEDGVFPKKAGNVIYL